MANTPRPPTATVLPRDAARTRSSLLDAARRRFALEGYSATTMRSVAGDAGVNVSLINRYFGSKEGLFASCLDRGLPTHDPSRAPSPSVDSVIETMLRYAVDGPDDDDRLQLLLLLRTSEDPVADNLRSAALTALSTKIAEPLTGGDDGDDRLLRVQLALGTLLGILATRTSTPVEPLCSADTDRIRDLLRPVLRGLLT
ncbi:MAG: TetR/AcrR family transcriptional regulator [Microbacterium sp.]|uniref:TetR/AcrR family transcriptional regulator n=1 Tax=Microbacterium sp. TaxID=51671 RepID=UPI003D6E0DE8